MIRSQALAVASLLMAATVAARPAAAAWSHDAFSAESLCTAAGDQVTPTSVSDGAGGSIVTWQDGRGGTTDIYAQRIDAAGVPRWTANGVALCTATGNQASPTIASDGAGGAIITWEDNRGGSTDIYARRISAAGVPQWTANGVAVCTASLGQYSPEVVSDGAHGAIVTWFDIRGGSNNDVYAQRISAAGAPLWTANGVALCTAAGDQDTQTIVPDGSGGAIVAWRDYRIGGTSAPDIYAQRINSTGAPQWAANGVVLCAATGPQYSPAIASDGAGGAIVTWQDQRGSDSDIYAQRVGATGVPVWTTDGVALCTFAGSQISPVIVSDGAGGAIVAWQDFRANNYDIYAQRIGPAGVLKWATDGVAVCTAIHDQVGIQSVADGANGVIVTWYDFRGSSLADIYAQRLDGAGAALWSSDGAAVCYATGDQRAPTPVSDSAGGAIITWQDHRSGTSFDIYAQRIERFGQLGDPAPVITGARDVPNDQGGFVTLSWDASYLDADSGVSEYRVFRSAPSSLAARAVSRGATTAEDEVAVRDGALLARASAGAIVYWEYVGTLPIAHLASYSMAVATTADSIASGNPRTLFMVEALVIAALESPRWFSAPDSGYSVDNLAPATPAPLTGRYASGAAHLHWPRNTETDLTGYRLYRGTSASFTPGPGSLVAALSDTGYADAGDAGFVYKLTAVDVHGNASVPAVLLPGGTVDVGDTSPALRFAAPSPNPARGATTLDYALSRPGRVRLAVFDAAGRLVQALRDGELPAGEHRERFALRDPAGRALASGLYLIRLEAEGQVLTRRLVAIR